MKNKPYIFNTYFLQGINPVIRFLILSDTVVVGGLSLLAPIFALFVEGFIDGGNAAVVGIASGVYLFTKSLLQIPVAHFIDKTKGERDDYLFLFLFSLLRACTPLLYLFINTPMQLYGVQLFLGVFAAFTYPSYMAIFTRHVDKNKEGTEWGVYFTLADLMGAAFAALGGFVAATYGFAVLIISVSLFSILGSFLLLPIRIYMKKQ